MSRDVTRFGLVVSLVLFAGFARAESLRFDYTHPGVVRHVSMVEPVDLVKPEPVKDGSLGKSCCPPLWAHRTGLFVEYLALRSNEGEVAYGVLADNVGTPPENRIQRSPVFTVDPGYTSNYRVGGTLALSMCSSIQLSYTNFYGSDSDAQSFDPEEVGNARIFPLSLHPFPQDAAQPTLEANARSVISFETADVDYRSMLWASELGVLNYLLGARYANLEQRYESAYNATGVEHLTRSDVQFDGGGIRFGLDGERHHCHNGFLVYGRGVVSMVAGQFRTSYQYESDINPGVNVIDTAWSADRIVTMLDLELGVGWQSQCGHFRVTSGYMIHSWFNTVTTDQWIRSVSRNNFVGQPDGMSYDTLMFDGLAVRAEYRF